MPPSPVGTPGPVGLVVVVVVVVVRLWKGGGGKMLPLGKYSNGSAVSSSCPLVARFVHIHLWK